MKGSQTLTGDAITTQNPAGAVTTETYKHIDPAHIMTPTPLFGANSSVLYRLRGGNGEVNQRGSLKSSQNNDIYSQFYALFTWEYRHPTPHLLVLVPQPLHFGVVHRQVPAVAVAQLIAAAAEQSVALRRHWLQRRQHCPAALRTTRLTLQVQLTAIIQITNRTLLDKFSI